MDGRRVAVYNHEDEDKAPKPLQNQKAKSKRRRAARIREDSAWINREAAVLDEAGTPKSVHQLKCAIGAVDSVEAATVRHPTMCAAYASKP